MLRKNERIQKMKGKKMEKKNTSKKKNKKKAKKIYFKYNN